MKETRASLTIVRYPKVLAWAGFLSMAVFRLPLLFNDKISFYKLLGCGKNGTFDKTPDLRQWGIITMDRSASKAVTYNGTNNYGSFINAWWRVFKCEVWTIILKPIEGHGTWDGKEAFGALPKSTDYEGIVAVLTRATIKLNRLKEFWKHVNGVAVKMGSAPGFITSVGVGEAPWIKQATFSVWQSKESMKDFAYKMVEHTEVIKKTRQQKWYSEDMFVRFIPIASSGSINGKNPLEGKL